MAGAVLALAPASEGRIIAGGTLRLLAGVDLMACARFLWNGNLDPSFQPLVATQENGDLAEVWSLLDPGAGVWSGGGFYRQQFGGIGPMQLLPDGRILIGDSFEVVNGVWVPRSIWRIAMPCSSGSDSTVCAGSDASPKLILVG